MFFFCNMGMMTPGTGFQTILSRYLPPLESIRSRHHLLILFPGAMACLTAHVLLFVGFLFRVISSSMAGNTFGFVFLIFDKGEGFCCHGRLFPGVDMFLI